MKESKQLYAFLLTVLIVFLAVSEPLYIIAAETNKGIKPTSDWTGDDWYQFCAFLAGKIGALGDGVIDAVHDFTNGYFTADGLKEKFDSFKAGVSVKDGKVVVSSDALNNFKGLIDSAIEDHGDYSMVPTFNFYELDYTSKMKSALYARFMSDVKNEYTFFANAHTAGTYNEYDFMHYDPDSIYFVFGTGSYDKCLYFYDLNGDRKYGKQGYQVSISSDGTETVIDRSQSSYIQLMDWVGVPDSNYTFFQLVTIDGHKVKVWKNEMALRNYLRGTGGTKIYTSSVFNNYDINNDNSLSIDASTVEYIFNQGDSYQVDMSKVINNVTNEINNYYINNGSSLTAEEIQKLIDESLRKLLDSLPSGGGEEPSEPETETETETETGGGDVSGNDVSGNDVSGNGVDGPQTVSLLQKILDKLSEIKKAIIGNTITGGLGDLISTGLDKLIDFADSVKDSVVSVVPEVSDIVSDIIDGTEETIGKMVDNVGTNMRPVGDKMKTKFPFSIPWDIAAVVGSMSAAPETPVFEVPIVFERYDIDYTLTIDMADFEVISKISRLFLSITFVLFLTKLTIQVVKMEKEL